MCGYKSICLRGKHVEVIVQAVGFCSQKRGGQAGQMPSWIVLAGLKTEVSEKHLASLQLTTDLAAYLQQTNLRGSSAFLFFPLCFIQMDKIGVLCSEPDIAGGFFFTLQTFHLNSLVVINV